MTIYYLFAFAFLLLGALQLQPASDRALWRLAWLLLVGFVGLRHHVGMDWNNYLHITQWIASYDWVRSFDRTEPGYVVLTKLSLAAGWGVYGVNLLVAAVFMTGLFSLCSKMPYKWLALAAAFPMLVVVVANSATRQSAAIGLFLWLIANWRSTGVALKIGGILLASSFHYSALIFMVFVMLDTQRPLYVKLILSSLVILATAYLVLQVDARAQYLDTYVINQAAIVISPGATLHVLLNAVPAAILVFFYRYLKPFMPNELIRYLAVLTLALLPITLAYPTAASRVSFYLFPVSICVFGCLPLLLRGEIQRRLACGVIAAAMIAQLWVWMNYANNRLAYHNYQNALFVEQRLLHLG